jgi:AraC family ethanolamine operon transcriptional activator
MKSSYSESVPAVDPHIGVLCANLDSFEPQSMEEVLSRTTLEHLQLARGHFQGQVMHAEFSASTLDWGSYNLPLLATGGMPVDRITLGFILTDDGASKMNGKSFSAPAPALFTEGTELYYHLAPGTQWMGFQVDRGQLEAIGLSVQQGFSGPATNATRPHQQLAQLLQQTLAVLWNHSGFAPDPEVPDPSALMEEAEAYLFDLMTSAIASAEPASGRDSLQRPDAVRLARLATDYILANMHAPLRIGAICSELQCDLKSLERAFQRVHGMSPRRFLTLCRLNKARQLLLDGTGKHSVTSAATACGIQHFGRFSQQYRSWFRERPSETLARSTDCRKTS